MTPFYEVQLSQGLSHFEKAVYFLPLSESERAKNYLFVSFVIFYFNLYSLDTKSKI